MPVLQNVNAISTYGSNIPVIINGEPVLPSESVVSCSSNHKQLQILLLGSSHVKHLGTYVAKQGLENFTLDVGLIHVMTLGKGGLCALHDTEQKCLAGQMIHVQTLMPGVLILHVGSNDLYSDKNTVSQIVNEIFTQAHCALNMGVSHVIISQQFKRNSITYFDDRVVRYNILTSMKCKQEPNISFWHHNGLWNPKNGLISILKSDGIHLNDRGNEKLFHSVKDAAVFGKNNCI